MKKNIRVLTAALLLAVMLTTNAGIADIYAEDSGNTGASGMQDEITSVDPTKDAAGVGVMTLKKGQKLFKVRPYVEGEFAKPYRFRTKNLPAAGALLTAEDSSEQITF